MRYTMPESEKARNEFNTELNSCVDYHARPLAKILRVFRMKRKKCVFSHSCKKRKVISFTSTLRYYGIVKCNGNGDLKKYIKRR